MPSERRFQRLLFALRKPLLLVLSLALALAAGELVVRVLGISPRVYRLWTDGEFTSFQRSENPLLGYEYKPNFREDSLAAAQAVATFASINSDGLRDVERSVQKPPGTRRIILLGDSVVSGHGTADLNHTISRRLEALFNDGQTEVLNVSVCGYNTRAEVELLRTKGLKYQPDLVVLLFTGNDYENANAGGDVAKYGGTMSGHRVLMSLCVHSSLARSIAVQLGMIRLGDTIDVYRWHTDAMGANNVVDGFETLKQLSSEHGFPVVVAVWPGFMPGEIIEWSERVLDGVDQEHVVARLAEEYGFGLMPLAPYFERHQQQLQIDVDPMEFYTVDMMHPSVVGANVAAQALLPVCSEILAGTPVEEALRTSRPGTPRITELAELDQPGGVAIRPNSNEVYLVDPAGRGIIRVASEESVALETVVQGFGSLSNSDDQVALHGLGFISESGMWITGTRGREKAPWLRVYDLSADPRALGAEEWTFEATADTYGRPAVRYETWCSVVALPGQLLVASRRAYELDALRQVGFARGDSLAETCFQFETNGEPWGLSALAIDPAGRRVVVGRMGGDGAARDSALLWFDPQSSRIQEEKPVAMRDLTGLAFQPLSSTLYAIDGSSAAPDEGGLYRIERSSESDSTAHATLVAPLVGPTSMAFDRRGRLYVTVQESKSADEQATRGRLLRIDGLN